MHANPSNSCHEKESGNNSNFTVKNDKFLIHNIININETEPINLSIKEKKFNKRPKQTCQIDGSNNDDDVNDTDNQHISEIKNNLSIENCINSSDIVTRLNQVEEEFKIYEENGILHMFRLDGVNNSEIYYCGCCDKIMKQGIIYGLNTVTPKLQSRSSRSRFSNEQIKVLKNEFEKNEKIDKSQRLKLSELLGIPEKQIMFWWQNERARSKRKKTLKRVSEILLEFSETRKAEEEKIYENKRKRLLLVKTTNTISDFVFE